MSLFEINKIIAIIIVTLVIFFIINKIGNFLINPIIPEEQAYKIEIPETLDSSINKGDEEIVENIDLISTFLATASLEKGQKLSNKCTSCHTFNKGGPNKIGPNLFGIIDKPIGKTKGYSYSKAMANFGNKWTYENIAAFLYKPKDYMNGTKMNFAGLKKVEDRANIVLWLRNNAESPSPLPQ